MLRFGTASYFLALTITAAHLLAVRWLGASTVAFVLAVWLEYTLVYVAVALVPALLVAGVASAPSGPISRALRSCAGRLAIVSLAVACVAALDFLLLMDVIVHRRFGFHLNGFVWNLLFTPGGIESMDLTAKTRWTAALFAAALLAANVALGRLALGAESFWGRWSPRRPRRAWLVGLGVFALLAGGERVAFAISSFTSYRPIIAAPDVMPLYVRARMRKLAERCGFTSAHDPMLELDTSGHALDYPCAPLELAAERPRWNVLWLVSESWRADTLNAEVMPETLGFARLSLWFRNHYSGGNGTRTGVFSMFYGLHGCLWFHLLNATRGPVLVDRLLDDGYQPFVYTSASFSYPEFDKTIWSRLPKEQLHEGDANERGWQRDRRLVTDLLAQIDLRDPSRPFLGFLFFESPHAQYWFPDESVIRRPYSQDVNYATCSRDEMPLVKNRYLNAVHHLDSQLGRIFCHLEERGLLDSTIVVVTGDHGEEFMEKGRFGHHSSFSEEQTRVPLLLHVPGMAPREVKDLSSHLDLAPTVLRLLGVTNPPADYSHGIDLLSGARRDHVVIADWDHLCVVDEAGKGIFPVNQRAFFGFEATDLDDRPIDESDWLARGKEHVAGVVRDLSRFLR